jgi:hypothetical protein
LIISIHCYVLFDMSYVFTYMAQRPLGSDRSSFLGCCTAWSRRLTWRWRLTCSRRLSRRRTVGRMMVGRMMVRRRRVQDRGEASRSTTG